jgi:hypothetical protein
VTLNRVQHVGIRFITEASVFTQLHTAIADFEIRWQQLFTQRIRVGVNFAPAKRAIVISDPQQQCWSRGQRTE